MFSTHVCSTIIYYILIADCADWRNENGYWKMYTSSAFCMALPRSIVKLHLHAKYFWKMLSFIIQHMHWLNLDESMTAANCETWSWRQLNRSMCFHAKLFSCIRERGTNWTFEQLRVEILRFSAFWRTTSESFRIVRTHLHTLTIIHTPIEMS